MSYGAFDAAARARLLAALATAALAVGWVGCGGSDSNDDDKQIRAAIEQTQRAFAAGDLKAVCASLTKDGQRHIGQLGHNVLGDVPPEPCAPDLEMIADGVKANGGLKQALEPEVVAIEVDGRRATATVSFGGDARGEVPLAKEGGKWKVDALYGGLPPDRREDVY